jgi:hypothetical protein
MAKIDEIKDVTMAEEMIWVEASYLFTGSFDRDQTAEDVVGRPADSSGSGFGARDLVWDCESRNEADQIKAKLDQAGFDTVIFAG